MEKNFLRSGYFVRGAVAFLALMLMLVTVLTGCSDEGGSGNGDSSVGDGGSGDTAEKNAAPDFRVSDGNGHDVRLSDFEGKPVVLNFWASWCPPCKAEMPDFDAAFKEYGGEVHFVMINLTDGTQETVNSAYKFIQNSGYTFPVYYDIFGEAASAYSIRSIPQTYFIDADGNIADSSIGMISAERLAAGIELILPVSE